MAAGKKTGGRGRGTRNKTTVELKDMVLQALAGAGGVKYLTAQAKTNPTAFLSLVGKVLPLQVKGAGERGEHVFRLEAPWLEQVAKARGWV